jgi:hypothetical protein
MPAPLHTNPIVVFLGPTLPVSDAQAAIDATFLAPATQGDILLAAHAFRPRAMVLIDGQFESQPAVRHKEILWAMAQGITVIGAASMGALRAAELHRFGMIGVGLIYRWYRRWPLLPDDAVAVQSSNADLGFLPLTDSMVDLQRTFSHLARRTLITSSERTHLTTIARSMNFRDRSFDAVASQAGLTESARKKFREEIVRQKRCDALLALQIAPELANNRCTPSLNQPWIATNTFIRDLIAGGIDARLLETYNSFREGPL